MVGKYSLSPKNLERSWGRSPLFDFFNFKSDHTIFILVESIAKRKAAHARLDTQDVVVDREQLLQGCLVVGLHLHGHLGVVNAREVASAGWLVLLGLQREGVHIDAGVGGASVVVERLY